MNEEKNTILLFDGVCNFCNDSVNFIIARDSNRYFKFAPLQSEFAEILIKKHNIDSAKTDSIILIENDRVFTYSTAALEVARKLDGGWFVLYGFIVVPKFIRDFFYKIFAKYRYRLFGRRDSCMIPTPEIRDRFLG